MYVSCFKRMCTNSRYIGVWDVLYKALLLKQALTKNMPEIHVQ